MRQENKVEISFYASLRQPLGQKTVEYNFTEPTTVKELIEHLIGQYPELEKELIDDTGELHAHINILVNGRDFRHLVDSLDTLLANGSQVSIFPALGGGRKGIIIPN